LSDRTHTQSNAKWYAMAGLGMGVFMATLDGSIVNISLPTLTGALHTSFAVIQWVVLSYVLVTAAFMLSVARLGDMSDKKKIYLAGLVLFVFGSALCGTSTTVAWLIAFRALQGLGAVMMQALGIAMITQIFPASERGRALGLMGGIVSIGIASGPALGGLIIGLLGWRFVFWVNIPVGILAFLMITRFVPSLPPAHSGQRFDPAGAAILAAAMASYALGMTMGQDRGFAVLPVQLLLAAALGGLALLLFVETRAAQPMIDLGLFRNLLFSVNLLMGMLVFITLAAGWITPFYLQLVRGYSTTQMGLLMMILPVTMGLVAPAAGTLSDRFGSRGISLAGLLVVAFGCFTMSTLTAATGPFGFALRTFPLGVGLGLFQSPNNSAIMGAVPRSRLGITSGLLALSRTLGQTTGMPLTGAIFTAGTLAAGNLPVGTDATTASPAALVAGFTGTYRIGTFMILGSACLALFAFWYDRRQRLSPRESAAPAALEYFPAAAAVIGFDPPGAETEPDPGEGSSS